MVVVSTYRRPWQTRLCLEAIARAQRWSDGWADRIAVCLSSNWHDYPSVAAEIDGVFKRNGDIPFVLWFEQCASNPHAASKWMLDGAFVNGAEIALYVEDDVVLAPDAFLLCEYTKQASRQFGEIPEYPACEEDAKQIEFNLPLRDHIVGCCCYHETIPEQYAAEGRNPDPALVHLYNGLNTCGGTAFLREPYLRYLAPEWNCKEKEPRGFDYSAHLLMYLHKLYMLNPDYSRSSGIGFTGGTLNYDNWMMHFGKSIAVTDKESLRRWSSFRLSNDPRERAVVEEPWMKAEIEWRKQKEAQKTLLKSEDATA